MQAVALEQALKRHYVRNQRWGFIWAIWMAVLWGAWYVPGTALWFEHPYVDIPADATALRLTATAVMTWVHAIGVFVWLLLWNGMLGKIKDYGRTMVRFRRISKWYALASLCGGPMAIFGSYMAMTYAGPVFAAISSLLFPVVGTVIAALWFKERITRRAALGMGIIILGGLAVYGPGLFGQLQSTQSDAWLGYVGGIMSALGWGAEGAVAARAMDVSDPDVGIQCRFSFEVFFWGLLILPAITLFTDIPVGKLLIDTLANGRALLWIFLAASTHAYCYTSWYKATSLIGVSRTGGIGNLYAVLALIFIACFTLQLPAWYFLIGLALSITGSFVMFGESAESVASLRDVTSGNQAMVEAE
ncbi:DMT family transporter [Paraburkholderia sacchari]|uniref:DMT family transporter n=1 Tax=Paraburkholderia sacchari TaxID=159450 RepID=UPI00054357CB|nr:DMT family transporter [Paraburkholderia sacchari]NLP62793.1 DMT family transporter [Paraburkholderia sacchari]